MIDHSTYAHKSIPINLINESMESITIINNYKILIVIAISVIVVTTTISISIYCENQKLSNNIKDKQL